MPREVKSAFTGKARHRPPSQLWTTSEIERREEGWETGRCTGSAERTRERGTESLVPELGLLYFANKFLRAERLWCTGK